MTDLSVIVAHKNRNALLERTLWCWRNQASSIDIEIIVVDDGSDNVPTTIATTFGARVVQTGAGGGRHNPSIAWNTGLKVATGKILACTGPEIMPDKNCARFLYNVPMGIEDGWELWAYAENTLIPDSTQLKNWMTCVAIPMYKLPQHADFGSVDWKSDVENLKHLNGFWNEPCPWPQNNNAGMSKVRGYMSHSTFSMSSDVWRWFNYMRPSADYGTDDVELVLRKVIAGISAIHAFNQPFVYHQFHGGSVGSSCSDLVTPKTLADARLLDLYPETANAVPPGLDDRAVRKLLGSP